MALSARGLERSNARAVMRATLQVACGSVWSFSTTALGPHHAYGALKSSSRRVSGLGFKAGSQNAIELASAIRAGKGGYLRMRRSSQSALRTDENPASTSSRVEEAESEEDTDRFPLTALTLEGFIDGNAVSSTGEQPLHIGGEGDIFDWKECWYPTFYTCDLDKEVPQSITVLGTRLVIWWDANATEAEARQQGLARAWSVAKTAYDTKEVSPGCWRAFKDQCPHRLVPLSEGRINEEGQLECPYHGWSFNGCGTCVAIPQLPTGGEVSTKRSAAAPVPVAVRQGMLFVYPGDPQLSPNAHLPTIPELETDAEWVCIDISRDLPYDATTLMENVLDSSHLPYTHHKSVGNRANASPLDLEIVSTGRAGISGNWEEGPRKGKLGAQKTVFVAPTFMEHHLKSKQFGVTKTAVYVTPTTPGNCRLFARFPFKFSSPIPRLFISRTPRWYSHLGQNTILEDDQIFLHLQERELHARFEKMGKADEGTSARNYSQACYLPTSADRYVLEYHKWLGKHAGGGPWGGRVSLPPEQTSEMLMDRYRSHVAHCKSCQGALKNFIRLRALLLASSVVAWLGSTIAASMGSGPRVLLCILAAGVAALALWWKLGQTIKRFYTGKYPPARNEPENRRLTVFKNPMNMNAKAKVKADK